MHKVLFCFFILGLFGVGGTVALSQRTVGEEPNPAQISPNLLPPGSERLLYRKLFYDAKRLTHARRDELEGSLHSTEAAEQRRQRLKQAYADLLGPLSEKPPLKAQVTGQIERKGYRIEKILFESQPGHHVTANLYVPTTGKPPYPGVLLACGHSDNGKAYPAYQAAASLMAKNDLVVLCYDPVSQGERIQLPRRASLWHHDPHAARFGRSFGRPQHSLVRTGRRNAEPRLLAHATGSRSGKTDRSDWDERRGNADYFFDGRRPADRTGRPLLLSDDATAQVRDRWPFRRLPMAAGRGGSTNRSL